MCLVCDFPRQSCGQEGRGSDGAQQKDGCQGQFDQAEGNGQHGFSQRLYSQGAASPRPQGKVVQRLAVAIPTIQSSACRRRLKYGPSEHDRAQTPLRLAGVHAARASLVRCPCGSVGAAATHHPWWPPFRGSSPRTRRHFGAPHSEAGRRLDAATKRMEVHPITVPKRAWPIRLGSTVAAPSCQGSGSLKYIGKASEFTAM